MSNFIKGSVLDSMPLHSINLKNNNIFSDIEDVYVGPDGEGICRKLKIRFLNLLPWISTIIMKSGSQSNWYNPVLEAIESMNPESLGSTIQIVCEHGCQRNDAEVHGHRVEIHHVSGNLMKNKLRNQLEVPTVNARMVAVKRPKYLIIK